MTILFWYGKCWEAHSDVIFCSILEEQMLALSALGSSLTSLEPGGLCHDMVLLLVEVEVQGSIVMLNKSSYFSNSDWDNLQSLCFSVNFLQLFCQDQLVHIWRQLYLWMRFDFTGNLIRHRVKFVCVDVLTDLIKPKKVSHGYCGVISFHEIVAE